ncbi:MAG: hypothetical protein MI919_36725, partial [Holophagales bacterium]|nr:hypothetical protein [Holophagales bacterium]
NGSRCVGLFARRFILSDDVFSMNSDAGRIEIAVQGDNVILGIPSPEKPELGLSLPVDDESVPANFVVAGVPYVVLFVDDLDSPWVEAVPPKLRTHEHFPNGTNVAVAHFDGSNVLNARFFERGVEEETPSSGSGCVALAAVTSALHDVDSPIVIHCEGGEFAIHFDRSGNRITNVRSAGKVSFVFEGILPAGFTGLN